MENADSLYNCFMAALTHLLEKNERGSQTTLSIDSKLSASAISQIINKSRKANFQSQIAIANAFGKKYEDFLKLGRSLIETGKPLPSPISDKEESSLQLPPKDIQNKKNNIITLNRRSTDPPPDERLQAIIVNLQKIYKAENEQLISGIELTLNAFVKTEKTRKVKIPER